ncbi:unnamed protein product [Diamesa serratosioi]
MVQLTDFFVNKANEELNENEERKNKALTLLREMILNHPTIKNCRTDSTFLLLFLRTKKYSIRKTLRLIENYLNFSTNNPKLFLDRNDNERIERLKDIYSSGLIYPLIQRDDDGRKIIFVQVKHLNESSFKSSDVLALAFAISLHLMEAEETQIAGLMLIMDCSGISMKKLKVFSMVQYSTMALALNDSIPGRFKGCYLVNLPSFANFFLDIIKLALSKKLKKRIFVLKTIDELKNHINFKIMPKEYGGEISQYHMITDIKGFLNKKDELMSTSVFQYDLREILRQTNIGTFRIIDND